jgi:hypothetical protein
VSGGLEVRGGAFGLDARYDDLDDLAGWLASTGARLALLGAELHRVLVDADLLASALLHPVGLARVEVALVAALDGPRGLLVAAARLEARAAQVQGAVTTYRGADLLGRAATDVRRRLVGAVGIPVALLALADPRSRAALLAVSPRSAAELEELVVEHPQLVGELVGAAPSFASTLALLGLGPAALLADHLGESVFGAGVLPGDVAEGPPCCRSPIRPGARRSPTAAGTNARS